MYTRMTFGRLMASLEASVTLNGAPVEVPEPVQILVPAWRTMPLRPGSMVKVMVDGATPLETLAINALLLVATL